MLWHQESSFKLTGKIILKLGVFMNPQLILGNKNNENGDVPVPFGSLFSKAHSGKSLGVLTLGLMVALGTSFLYAAGSFEGEVDYHITAKDTTMEVRDFIKGKKLKMDSVAKGHESSMIMDMNTHQMMTVMPQQKMYMTMAMPEGDKTKKPMEGKFYKSGKTQVILGKTCEEWIYEGKNGQGSVWCAAGMGNFMAMGKPGSSANYWADVVKAKGLFPLKVVYKDKTGNVAMTMEATKIEEKSLDEFLFEPPAGYKKLDMGNLGAMLQGMGGKNPNQ